MSRTVQFSKLGGPEVLELIEETVAEPKANEVRITVKALGLNRAEAMFRCGQYLEEAKLPARLGYEAAGIIDAVGEGVTQLKVGDVVSTVPNFSLNSYGMYGEQVIAPATAVLKHPTTLSFDEAASIWMMFVTAYDGLIGTAKLEKGEVVLIPAASSSVGIAAIQIANMIGAVPVALTRTSAKKEQLKQAGAAHVIATEEEDLVEAVKKITSGKGANVIFDPVAGPTFSKLLEASASGVRAIIYGVLSDEPTTVSPKLLIGKLPVITGSLILSTSADPERLRIAYDFVVNGLKNGALKPVIAKTFKFDDIVEAHKYLESNQQFGKIVVSV
jgi:NADPH:quinone reductase-like Zn-dependent oxidoreductase